jgi:hypothetical protein
MFFAALPFINRDRMRGGDLIAGTMVISCRSGLAGDLVERALQFAFAGNGARLWRSSCRCWRSCCAVRSANSAQVLSRVAADLPQDRLDDASQPGDVLPFLREFYTAERAFLEREQLYGKVRADKFAQPNRPG